MKKRIYDSHPPQIEELLRLSVEHQLSFVLVGSVAAIAYGVDVGQPGDLDIVPALDRQNLKRVIEMLEEIEAAPRVLGHWEEMENGELKWFLDDDSPEVPLNWSPDIDDLSSLDHLYHTRLGNFDVVPRIAGDYEALNARSLTRSLFGIEVQVVHIDELLARLTVPRRNKDVEKVKMLREIQRNLAS